MKSATSPQDGGAISRATKDGKKRHAWKVRYRDPDRIERAQTFAKRVDAENFAASIETDILRNDYVGLLRGRGAFKHLSIELDLGLGECSMRHAPRP